MTATLSNITFDCADAATLAGFWSQVLGRPLSTSPAPSEYFASIGEPGHDPADAPRWFFLKVPEPKPATKNRVHVDLATEDREVEVERLVALGATRVDDQDELGLRWTVLRDPEGNEFCVAGP
ncbi:MAG TPA: VOC family protein [Acidimicrobiales bacterium]|nr:VOC family protein [Acidimicrobiales bacterium]